jgi:hypothetical protein
MTYPISQPEAPSFFNRSIDAIGAALLTAIVLIAVGISSAQYGAITGDVGPGAVAAAFAHAG